jgi:hypothetical protein
MRFQAGYLFADGWMVGFLSLPSSKGKPDFTVEITIVALVLVLSRLLFQGETTTQNRHG